MTFPNVEFNSKPEPSNQYPFKRYNRNIVFELCRPKFVPPPSRTVRNGTVIGGGTAKIGPGSKTIFLMIFLTIFLTIYSINIVFLRYRDTTVLPSSTLRYTTVHPSSPSGQPTFQPPWPIVHPPPTVHPSWPIDHPPPTVLLPWPIVHQ